MAEEEKRLEQLLEKAKSTGKLSITELQEAADTMSMELDQIMDRCSAMQIELVEDDAAMDDYVESAVASSDEVSNDDSVKI